VYHRRSGEDLTRTRLEVDAAGATVELTREPAGAEPEPPVRLTIDELASRLTGLLLEPAA
jgi:hypothetical protein